ncbi:hypothetical protein HPB48_005441 [Haemaphysalis longicornis]|uniref:Tc1-like transposase DDE domain-containing protein n=1 Tax=Haemaphysalis longicornis TaxID=44386 RepID=A0A9J6GE41_HAELO|nr:hypothetical protein HPB48_005441 [Haemaphysalis longicornis]
MTSVQYCNILGGVLTPICPRHVPDGNYQFQQDLSPVHSSRAVKDYLAQQQIPLMAWCPKGADLNIIENVWGRLKAAMVRRPIHPATADQMWTAISDEWEQLRGDQAFVSALYQSLPSRIEAVIVGDGEMTRY